MCISLRLAQSTDPLAAMVLFVCCDEMKSTIIHEASLIVKKASDPFLNLNQPYTDERDQFGDEAGCGLTLRSSTQVPVSKKSFLVPPFPALSTNESML
jgi:hypothetical protein